MTGAGLVLTVHDVGTAALMADCMTVMDAAFDPRFGEAWTAGQMSSMLDLPGTRLVAGRIGDVMAGFGLIRSIAGESELLLLGVMPSVRRHGHGRKILDRCISIAAADGAKIMFLEVREGNNAAALYRSAYFEQYSIRRDYYLGRDGERRSALSFRRTIAVG